jgi:hypothetical protein
MRQGHAGRCPYWIVGHYESDEIDPWLVSASLFFSLEILEITGR